jgi:putative ABC transport system permease protein
MNRLTGFGWRLLRRDCVRSAVGMGGIAMATLIVFVEWGFMNGVIDSQLRIVDAVRGDLIVLDARRTHLNKWESLQPIRAQQIAAVEGVRSVTPVYQTGVPFRRTPEQSDQRIIIIAFPPDDPPLELDWNEAALRLLRQPGTVLLDHLSRPIYGQLTLGQDVWLDGFRFKLGGFVKLGPTLINDGQIVMSESTLLKMQPGAKPQMVLVRVSSGADVSLVQARIREQLGSEIDVFRKSELAHREDTYLRQAAPLGLLFGAGMIAGLFVGWVICYQVLYDSVRRRLKAYITLKAMGFGDGFIMRTVLQQALQMGVGGCALGAALAAAVYTALAYSTGLAFQLTWVRGACVATACLVTCMLAGCMAALKVIRSNPADLY